MTGTLGQTLERALAHVARVGFRKPLLSLVIVALMTAVTGAWAWGVRLDADLTGLLPKSFESIRGLEELQKRFGGIGYVVVVGQGKDIEGLRRFAEDAAARLQKLPDVRWVDYRRETEFFKDHGLYYLSTSDLETIHDRLQARYKFEKRKANPLYVQLEDEAPPSVDFTDILDRVAGSTDDRLAGDGEPYYLDAKAGQVVVMAKPARTSVDLKYAKQLLDRVKVEVRAMDLTKYGPGFQTAMTGTFQKKVDQQAQISSDIAVSSGVAFLLVILYLIAHFRSIGAVAMVLLPTTVGLVWTYGFVGEAYGSVNLLTGFLGAILGGLGTEHGIHLLGRFAALRREGREPEDAAAEAFAHTGTSALVSAVVAALTFLSLAISEFRAFREFGVIAAFGMVAVWVAYMALLPALVALWTRWAPNRPLAPPVRPAKSYLARYVPRFARPILVVGVLAMLALTVMARDVSFDYDFAALEDGSLPSFRLDHDVNKILGYSQTPVVLLTDRPQDERAVVDELHRRSKQLGKATTIDFVGALEDLVPLGQPAKRDILDRIALVTDRIDPARIEKDQRGRFEDLRRAVAAKPFARADLPPGIRRQFEGIGVSKAGFVLVFPSVSLADGEKVQALAKEVRKVPLADGRTVTASGDAMVLADILEMVVRESPWVLLAATLSVLLATWLMLGSLGLALVCIAPTVLSMVALAGVMPLLGLPFNYLNILVVPVLVGTTVDGAVHLVTRLREPGEPFEAAYAETSRAVAGGLLTSAVGFGALLMADHPGLQSVGKLAILGFTVNLLFMLLFLPASLWIARRWQTPAAASAAPEASK